jgi:hypothetical protein
MGSVTLKELGGFQKHENTQIEYDNELSYDLLEHRLKKIASLIDLSGDKVCYIIGMGGRPKSTFYKLQKTEGVNLIWYGSIFPKYLRILSIFIASYAGLVKVIDSKKLPDLFLDICDSSMAGIYIFNKSMEKKFVDEVIKNPLPVHLDFGIKYDASYFLYVVDADNNESSTGIYEIISYGKNATDVATCF